MQGSGKLFMVENKVVYSGRVALVGRPNVGKSSLLNNMLDTDLCVVNRKAQTTRHQILGVKTEGVHQYVFLDTPGINHKAKGALNTSMNRVASTTMRDADIILFMVD